MHKRLPLIRGTISSILIAILVAACSAGIQGAGGAGGASSGGDATIGFTSPTDGATVSVPFDVELEASEPLDEPQTGNRHAHIYFDTTTDAADYDIVYGTTWQVTRPLEPGEHTLTVALANPDHSLAGPTQAITVTVGGDGTVESPGGPASPPGPVY